MILFRSGSSDARDAAGGERHFAFLALFALLAGLAAGCGGGRGVQGAALGGGAAATGTRAVSLAPSLTELAFAVGAGGRLVAVTSHCDAPDAARALPKVGGYGTPSVEAVAALRPTLVLVPEEGSLLGPVEKLRALGLRVEPVRIASLADLVAGCRTVGALLGEPAGGDALAERLRARIAAVEAAVATAGAGRPRPRVLLVVDHGPLVAAGKGTFLDALIEAAGGANVARAAASAWPQLSTEALLALAPEVIVDTSMVPEATRRTDAPPGARLVSLPPELLVRPGPRLVDGLEALARALHPHLALPKASPR